MSEIKKGDQVILKSGGPRMTVKGIGEFSMEGIKNGATCIWFDNFSLQEEIFDIETIELI